MWYSCIRFKVDKQTDAKLEKRLSGTPKQDGLKNGSSGIPILYVNSFRVVRCGIFTFPHHKQLDFSEVFTMQIGFKMVYNEKF